MSVYESLEVEIRMMGQNCPLFLLRGLAVFKQCLSIEMCEISVATQYTAVLITKTNLIYKS